MNLGIVADEIDRDFATAVRIGIPLGLRRYEIRNLVTGRAPLCEARELEEVERIAQGEGVAITALSPGLFKLTADAAGFRREMAEVYPRAAEWARRWNLPGLIVFGFARGNEAAAEFFAEAAARAAADRLLLTVEPEPICRIGTARAAAELIARTGSEALRINYDPGNVAWLQNRDPLEEFAGAAPYVANVHVKDMLPLAPGAHEPQWVPAGEGIIDYPAHFAALRRAAYSGPISLEPHMNGRPETIRRCVEAFEKTWSSLPEPNR